MNSLSLYWILKLDDIRVVVDSISVPFLVIGILCCIVSIISKIISICSLDNYDENIRKIANTTMKSIKPYAFTFTTLGTILYISSNLIPSTQQFAIMYVVPSVINNENVKEIPKKLLNLTSEWVE